MRVQVQIPGTVESYCVDEHGKKLEATEENWLETYLCSVLRAYSYADNGSGDTIKKIIGVRRFNPITNSEHEQRFLDAAEQLFFNGKCRNELSPIIANRHQAGSLALILRSRYLMLSQTISLTACLTISRSPADSHLALTCSRSCDLEITKCHRFWLEYTSRRMRRSRLCGCSMRQSKSYPWTILSSTAKQVSAARKDEVTWRLILLSAVLSLHQASLALGHD